jgi:hypothetical protein
MDPSDLKPTWPVVIASLEQLTDWGPMALRLGILALIQECTRALAQREAKAHLLVRLRELEKALSHMPFEP